MKREKCQWCDKPAIRFCDAAIGFEVVGAVRAKNGELYPVTGLDAPMHTCDAAMCATHATQVGHICGTPPESIDYCPWHFARHESIRDLLVSGKDDADRRRREIFAEVRREAMRGGAQ